MVAAAIHSAVHQSFDDIEVRVEYAEANWPTKLNDAVATTRGEWLVILCDDDLLHLDYLAACVPHFAEAEMVYTDRKVFRDGRPEDGLHFRMHGAALSGPEAYAIGFPPDQWIFGSSLPMTCCIKRTLWDALQGHDPQMPHSDTEFWYRATIAGARFVYVPQALFYYRQHADQWSRWNDTMQPALQSFHRKHFPAFGVAWEPRTASVEAQGRVLDVGERLAYATVHFTPLTTIGYMASETKDLPMTAKLAVQFKQREAEASINAIIQIALLESGLDPADGWKIDPNYNAVREIPEIAAGQDLSKPLDASSITSAPDSGE